MHAWTDAWKTGVGGKDGVKGRGGEGQRQTTHIVAVGNTRFSGRSGERVVVGSARSMGILGWLLLLLLFSPPSFCRGWMGEVVTRVRNAGSGHDSLVQTHGACQLMAKNEAEGTLAWHV